MRKKRIFKTKQENNCLKISFQIKIWRVLMHFTVEKTSQVSINVMKNEKKKTLEQNKNEEIWKIFFEEIKKNTLIYMI